MASGGPAALLCVLGPYRAAKATGRHGIVVVQPQSRRHFADFDEDDLDGGRSRGRSAIWLRHWLIRRPGDFVVSHLGDPRPVLHANDNNNLIEEAVAAPCEVEGAHRGPAAASRPTDEQVSTATLRLWMMSARAMRSLLDESNFLFPISNAAPIRGATILAAGADGEPSADGTGFRLRFFSSASVRAPGCRTASASTDQPRADRSQHDPGPLQWLEHRLHHRHRLDSQGHSYPECSA